jgi:hypothetical protein
MVTTRRLVLLVLLVVCQAGMSAGQRPSFSGTWIIQPPNKAAGQEQVIKQDDQTLSITSSGRTLIHKLDGVEHRETHAMRGGEIELINKAAWAGSTIVIETTTNYPNKMKTVAKEIWSIDAKGQLVIDFTETMEGQPPRVLKVIHIKKS